MTRQPVVLLVGTVLWLATLFWLGLVQADDTGGYRGGCASADHLEQARQAIDPRSFGSAIPLLEEARRGAPGNADTLNLPGFSHRKLGEYDTVERYHLQALAIEP